MRNKSTDVSLAPPQDQQETELAKAMGYKRKSPKLRDVMTELLLQKQMRAIVEGQNAKCGLRLRDAAMRFLGQAHFLHMK